MFDNEIKNIINLTLMPENGLTLFDNMLEKQIIPQLSCNHLVALPQVVSAESASSLASRKFRLVLFYSVHVLLTN